MEKARRNIGPALILLAGCFWGSMGIFVRRLADYGFSSIQIVAIRVTLAALIFCMLLLIKDPSGFRISVKDIPLFLGLGFGSILFFTVCYFTAITMMPLSTAATLLYTSPIWIMLMSVLFFHEKLTGRKLLALVLAFAGCVLVSGISGEGMTLTGLLVGLGSGIGYGLYSILGTVALRRYSPYTVTTYTFAFAALGAWLICRPAGAGSAGPGFLLLSDRAGDRSDTLSGLHPRAADGRGQPGGHPGDRRAAGCDADWRGGFFRAADPALGSRHAADSGRCGAAERENRIRE